MSPMLIFILVSGIFVSLALVAYAVSLMSKQRREKDNPTFEEPQLADELAAAAVTATPDEVPEPDAAPANPAASEASTGEAAADDVGEAPAALSPTTSKYQFELARLLRDKQTGELIVEINGQQYLYASDLEDEHARVRLESAATSLLDWLGLSPSPSSPDQPAGQEPLPGVRPPAPLSSGADPAMPEIPGMRPLELLHFLRKRPRQPEQKPLKSVVEQIDDVLQIQITHTPLGERGVSIAPMSDGGLRVEVGNEVFVGIEAVPYQEVKEAIRAAARTWEESL